MALVALVGVLAAGGAASTAAAAPARTIGTGRSAMALSIPVEKSTVTAGYLSEMAGIKTVSTTFEVPKITNCTSGHDAGMGPIVILTGNDYFVGAGAEAECQGGQTSYLVAVNHNGSESHLLTIDATDEIKVSIVVGPTGVSVSIDDLTTKQKTSQVVPRGKVTATELADDSLSEGKHQVAIPQFTDHQFSDVKVNGRSLADAPPLIEEELVSGKTVLIEAGPLDKAGDGFVMRFEHAT